MGLKDLMGAVKEGGDIADKLSTSDLEIAQELTRRQEIDMTSSFKLPHIIRPLSFLIVTCLQVVLSVLVIILAFTTDDGDPTNMVLGVMATNSATLATMSGFYFQSRKNEKIAFRNAKANEELDKMKLEHEIKKEEMSLKNKKVEDRIARRLERKNKNKNE